VHGQHQNPKDKSVKDAVNDNGPTEDLTNLQSEILQIKAELKLLLGKVERFKTKMPETRGWITMSKRSTLRQPLFSG
jgi:hypothetical protein